MKKLLLKISDLLGGIFLIFTGLFLIFLYACLYSKTDNWFMSFAFILFLLGLGIGAFILGLRRLFLTLKEALQNKI